MKKHVVVYTRVSTDKEEQEKSLEVQKGFYKQYCIEKGYELLDDGIYADVGSATSVRRRPHFIRMMEDAGLIYERNNQGTDIFRTSNRKAKFDMIIVKDASRFSRNSEIGIAAVKQLRSKKVNVLFENAGVASFDDNANLMLPLLFTIAENESEGLSKKVSFTKRYNSLNGVYNPARLPYGYERNEENEKVINEEQAKIVRFVNDNYPEQGSYILSRRLNEKGILTQTGKEWSADKITRMIALKAYTGNPQVGKSKKYNVTDTERVTIPKKEWVEIENGLPQIITFDQYEYNNMIRESRISKTSKRGQKLANNDDYFQKIHCAGCGSKFARHKGRNNKKSPYKMSYMCMTRRKKGHVVCNVRGISFSIIDDFLDRVDISILSNDMSNHTYYKSLMKELNSEARNLQQRIDDYTAQIDKLEEENGTISRGIVEQLTGGSQATIDMLSKNIDKNTAEIDKLTQQRDKINIESIEYIRKMVDNKKQMIEEIGQGQSLNRDEKLKLLKSITVSDYDVVIDMHMPSYLEEVEEFNSIFTDAAIQTDSIGFKSFRQTYRREHKEARDFWLSMSVDQQ